MLTRRFASIAIAAVVLAACANENPQTDEVRAAQTLGLTKLTTSSDEARQEFRDGVNDWDLLHYESAYDHFKRAIAADPNFAMAELYAERAAGQAGSSVEQAAHLKRALELSKAGSDMERLEIESENALFNGNLDDADKLAREMIKLEPNSFRAWYQLGAIYVGSDPLKVREAWAKAAELNPQHAGVRADLSQSYVQGEPRDLAKGEALAREAVKLAPNEPYPHDVLGDALRGQGKLQEAAVEYTKQADLDPTQGDGYQQRAHCNTFLGRFKEARADYDAAVAATTGNRKPGLGAYRANVHLFEGSPKAAYEELNDWLKQVDAMNIPGALDIKKFIANEQALIAYHYHMIPELEKTTALLNDIWSQQAKQVNSADFTRQAEFSYALNDAYLALAKGDFATASAKAAQARTIRAPERSATKEQPIHALEGDIALHQKKYAEALLHFAQASPNDRYTWFLRAEAAEGAGDQAEAKKWYELIANTYFNDPAIAITRNEVLKKIGKAS